MTLPIKIETPDVNIYNDFNRRMQISDDLCLAGGARWSIYQVVDQLDEVATKGTDLVLMYRAGDDHWGNENIAVRLPDNPTWRQLAVAAAEAIELSGDRHHIFIEAFMRKGATLTMFTGS